MERRKKILFIITKSNWGGAQRYVYDLATSLPRAQYDIAVACGGTGLLVEKLRAENIPVFEVKSFQRDISIRKELSSVSELWKLYKTFRPDIVHLNSSKAGGIGALTARCVGIQKIIFTAHGWPFWEPRNILQKSLIAFFSWLSVLFTHVTICISESDARTGRRMPFVSRKIRLIRNGIAPYIPLRRDEAREALFDRAVLDEHAHDVWVLTNAELTRNKNHTAGIDAVCAYNASAAQKIFYVCMGDGELHNSLAAHIKKNDAEKNVAMIGFVQNGSRYYNAFDIFLLPSRKEGVPYVLLEAGIAGLPCVAGNVGGIPEVMTHEKSGLLIRPDSVEEIKKALENLCKDAVLRQRLGAGLHEKVTHLYSTETMLTETQRVYEEHTPPIDKVV